LDVAISELVHIFAQKSSIMHLQDIGIRIKERRSILGITQKDLAGISGVGLRTLKDIETGAGNPSLDTLLKIIDVLGLELDLKIKRTVE
jgi:y4mF family transcriptional regulator